MKKKFNPDIERIIYAVRMPERHREVITDWLQAYKPSENSQLKTLLETETLEACYYDFLFLLWMHFRMKEGLESTKEEFIDEHNERRRELLHTLKFLYDNEMKTFKIEMKYRHSSALLENQYLIDLIRKAFLHELIKSEYIFVIGRVDPKYKIVEPKDVKNWGKIIDFILTEWKSNIEVQKGRKGKAFNIGEIINALQRYLQKYTKIKADEGIIISRKQALIIYEILSLYGFIEKGLSYGGDAIRVHLKKFIEGGMGHLQEKDYLVQEKEHKESIEKLKAKIKNINKN